MLRDGDIHLSIRGDDALPVEVPSERFNPLEAPWCNWLESLYWRPATRMVGCHEFHPGDRTKIFISPAGVQFMSYPEWIALPTPEGVFVARVKYSRLSHYLPHTIVKMYASAITSTSGFVTHVYSS